MENINKFISNTEDSTLRFLEKVTKVENSDTNKTIEKHIGFCTKVGIVVNGISSLANITTQAAITANKGNFNKGFSARGKEVFQNMQTGASVGAIVGMGVGLVDVYLQKSARTRNNLKEKADQLLNERNKKVKLGRKKKVTTLTLPVPSQINTDYSRKFGAR